MYTKVEATAELKQIDKDQGIKGMEAHGSDRYDFFPRAQPQQPKAKITIFRHAETVWNAPRKRIQGQSPSLEIVLSKKGKEDVLMLAKQLKIPDMLICSPLLRCKQTAEALFGMSFDCQIIPKVLMDNLREVNAGRLEGLYVDELQGESKTLWELWQKRPQDFPGFPDGETLPIFQERVLKAFSEICIQYGDQEIEICIISHGGPLRILRCFLENKDLSHLWDVPISNLDQLELTPDHLTRLQQLQIETVRPRISSP